MMSRVSLKHLIKKLKEISIRKACILMFDAKRMG